jgi:O-antigen/teichoic acid export membrane protein
LNFSLRKNTYSSIGQVIFTGFSLFLLYKFLIRQLGLEQLGIWSLLLSISSSVGILNSGFTGSIVRYVAEFHAEKNNRDALKLVQTFFTSILALFLFISGLLLINQELIIQYVKLGEKNKEIFTSLLPFALTILLLSTLSGVFLSALEGIQKLYIKNFILMGSSLITLLAALLFVPLYQIKGITFAYISAHVFSYLVGWYCIRKNIEQPLLLLPLGWNTAIFKKTFSYNIKFQAISISSILNDPLLRIIMVRYTGLQTAGLYELASKIIMQMRALLITATQALVPVFASLGKERKEEALHFYNQSYGLTFFAGLFSFSILAAGSPLISVFLIGYPSENFVWLMVILSFGWLANSLSTPAYFANTGFGTINSNLITHLIINIVSLSICFGFALIGLGFWLITGWTIALLLGTVYLMTFFIYSNKLPYSSLIPKGGLSYLLISAFGFLAAILIVQTNVTPTVLRFSAAVIFYTLVQLGYFYFSGTGQRLISILFSTKKSNNPDNIIS